MINDQMLVVRLADLTAIEDLGPRSMMRKPTKKGEGLVVMSAPELSARLAAPAPDAE